MAEYKKINDIFNEFDNFEVKELIVITATPKNQQRKIMAGKFEKYKDKGGKFRFRLKAGNGQNIQLVKVIKQNQVVQME